MRALKLTITTTIIIITTKALEDEGLKIDHHHNYHNQRHWKMRALKFTITVIIIITTEALEDECPENYHHHRHNYHNH